MQDEFFQWKAEQFADIKILRYQVPGFNQLPFSRKLLIFYLSRAALCGRDIIFDQNGKYNLRIRRTLEAIVLSYQGDRGTREFGQFLLYTKRVWFSNGIHHHYSTDKFIPECSSEYFRSLVLATDKALLPLKEGQTVTELLDILLPIIFDPAIMAKKVTQEENSDLVKSSAVNFYEGVSEQEVLRFYSEKRKSGGNMENSPSWGLNSKLVKEQGELIEKSWHAGGMYSAAILEIVNWLDKARQVAETPGQAKVIELLCSYYKTGDLALFDRYNIAWVEETEPLVDFVNGFIEVYNDPIGIKATWEAIVNFKNLEATRRTELISSMAQWFEDHSPVDERFKKKEVKGVSAKVIHVVTLGGDCYPATPIGINLPNADWIRKEHGSKSVTIENITYAYDQAAKNSGFLEEFAATEEEMEWNRKYGFISDNLHTDLHECLGHGSGQVMPGVVPEALKNYHSTLEEARADLFALYYMLDPKIIEIGLLPDQNAAKSEYASYIRNGLFTQMVRIEEGKNFEEAHMRNRALIARWCMKHGQQEKVIEQFEKNGKTYFRINDYQKLRGLFGKLLAEVQRIKSEGDYDTGKKLVEEFGVQVDPVLHMEVLERYRRLNLAPYAGFINPELNPVIKDGEIIDIQISYPIDYMTQMLQYSREYSFLPHEN